MCHTPEKPGRRKVSGGDEENPPEGKSPPRGRVSIADKELGLRNCLVNFTSVGKQAKDSKNKK